MRPWQVLLIAALILNGLIISALLFTENPQNIRSVVAGAFIPLLISGALLIWAEYSKTKSAQDLQKINIIGFFFKIILLGVWAAILLKAGTLDNMTFIVSLVINFLAWHGVEAYYWPLFTAGVEQNKGEIS